MLWSKFYSCTPHKACVQQKNNRNRNRRRNETKNAPPCATLPSTSNRKGQALSPRSSRRPIKQKFALPPKWLGKSCRANIAQTSVRHCCPKLSRVTSREKHPRLALSEAPPSQSHDPHNTPCPCFLATYSKAIISWDQSHIKNLRTPVCLSPNRSPVPTAERTEKYRVNPTAPLIHPHNRVYHHFREIDM